MTNFTFWLSRPSSAPARPAPDFMMSPRPPEFSVGCKVQKSWININCPMNVSPVELSHHSLRRYHHNHHYGKLFTVNYNHEMGHEVRKVQLSWHKILCRIKLRRLTLILSWTEVLGGPMRMISREDNQNKWQPENMFTSQLSKHHKLDKGNSHCVGLVWLSKIQAWDCMISKYHAA